MPLDLVLASSLLLLHSLLNLKSVLLLLFLLQPFFFGFLTLLFLQQLHSMLSFSLLGIELLFAFLFKFFVLLSNVRHFLSFQFCLALRLRRLLLSADLKLLQLLLCVFFFALEFYSGLIQKCFFFSFRSLDLCFLGDSFDFGLASCFLSLLLKQHVSLVISPFHFDFSLFNFVGLLLGYHSSLFSECSGCLFSLPLLNFNIFLPFCFELQCFLMCNLVPHFSSLSRLKRQECFSFLNSFTLRLLFFCFLLVF